MMDDDFEWPNNFEENNPEVIGETSSSSSTVPLTKKRKIVDETKSYLMNLIFSLFSLKFLAKICGYCQKSISTTNYSKHLKSQHAEEILKVKNKAEEKQSKIGFPVVSTSTKANRLFVLYAGTTTFPSSHVNNKYLKVYFRYSH